MSRWQGRNWGFPLTASPARCLMLTLSPLEDACPGEGSRALLRRPFLAGLRCKAPFPEAPGPGTSNPRTTVLGDDLTASTLLVSLLSVGLLATLRFTELLTLVRCPQLSTQDGSQSEEEPIETRGW